MENLTNNMTNLPEERGWEYKQITVTRVPGYGFGIAVSGGRDNPHFASGDPSIAVSDVLVAGPAERTLQVNDRIISVNGISLQNVDYATAVQVLRDSGDTVVLVVKRRTNAHQHQHQHSLSASYSSPPPVGATVAGIQPAKITLTKNSKKEDFGIVLGCKLFIKEISSKARDQLLATNQYLIEGDFITKINNTNCNDIMSLKEAKKIIDNSKDKLNLTIARDISNNATISHQTQSSVSTTGAVNNYYKGDDYLMNQSYSNQNLYVQPPTRNPNLNTSNGFMEEKPEPNPTPAMLDDKSNLAPRGRLRGPLSDANLSQLDRDRANSMSGYGKSKRPDEPPRPPPPRAEDYYSSRRQLYEEDPLIQKAKQSIPDARFITFQKEGSVGIRLTGGNYVGIFVTAVQPGSPASLQGLQPGDKILKVNDMDMSGVTREEAVLFLLSLQDRIELIVQFCKEEYDNIVASQRGDSFYIKTHFHYDNPAKGEMSFRSGDTFHVVDTLYNGVVGCWQVYRVGRNNQQLQKGIIPNKARAEELATAQFNATKKEMSTNESRGSFFRRRRSSNRRSKSLGKEHWDDILFSDCVSKFPAYERVVLKHPGFTRPVILFGPIADIARDKMLKDFPDKFISPQLETGTDEPKAQKSSNIIRLSAIRDVISTGKHALLDITPNAVERLNYAQLYPIVIFFKAESKIIIKQLRQGLPKSAHKSSKKLLEQCQKLDKVWNHIFSATVTLNDNTENWYRKVRELIDKQQTGALWMSESKPEESLSDDFLFPMSSLRLSYASSPESDLEHSPGPPVSLGATTSSGGPGSGAGSTGGRLAKASSDPSVVMPADSNTDTLPPYQPTYDSRYGFSSQNPEAHSNNISPDGSNHNHNAKDGMFMSQNQLHLPPDGANINDSSGNMYKGNHYGQNISSNQEYHKGDSHKRQSSNIHAHYSSKSHNLNDNSPLRNSKEGLYGTAPDLPPRVDRTAKPASLSKAATTTSTRSAHERLFGTKASGSTENNNNEQQNMNPDMINNKHSSLERRQNSKSDSLSSYDSFNSPNSALKQRLGPNAHDDLKSSLPKVDAPEQMTPTKYPGGRWDQPPPVRHNHEHVSRHGMNPNNVNDGRLNDHNSDNMSPRHSREVDKTAEIMTLDQLSSRVPGESRNHEIYNRYNRSPSKPPPPKHVETKTDYGKYSRNNSSSQDYSRHSHQDLTQAHLSIHQSAPAYHHSPMKSSSGMYSHSNGVDSGNIGHISGMNGPPNTYKPVPPPKPKNYKPPFKNQPGYGGNEGGNMGSPNGGYQHGKSHSNPVNDQRNANYYYNMPTTNEWHTETAVRYSSNMHGHYDMSPSGNGPNPGNGSYEQRRHTSISYSSRNEAMMQMTSTDIPPYGRMDHVGTDPVMDARPNIVDLQGSREQRGSAFELYRKPVHHNMSLGESTETNITGSHLSISSTNNSENGAISSTMSLATSTNSQTKQNNIPGSVNNSNNNLASEIIENTEEILESHVENSRDVTTAILDHRGGILVNEYWGVSLEVPENALPVGIQQEIYFVITDPRTCDNAPPLDLENGETMLSPLVMCGPQGTEFLKPVILNIPHYANTLPSMAISLKATDSEKDIHTDWDNILLPSNHAANSVAVKVDHF